MQPSHQTINKLHVFLALRPVIPLIVASGGWLPAQNEVCLHPVSNLDHYGSLSIGKAPSNWTIRKAAKVSMRNWETKAIQR